MSSPASRSRGPRRGGGPAARATRETPGSPARHRFLDWDDYRAEREWRRYEGTPLRDLYRQLRVRFLLRHQAASPGWALEVGPGPGRFTGLIGSGGTRVATLDMSRTMLGHVRSRFQDEGPVPDLVQGDAVLPPFVAGRFQRVALLGNVLGFAEADAPALLRRVAGLVQPEGRLLLEFVAGPGEWSQYLHRLPPGALGRLMAAPIRAILPRVRAEGFSPVREYREKARRFWRFAPEELSDRLRQEGLIVRETLAVAPCLGNDASRLSEIRTSAKAWAHLLEVEEEVGHDAARWASAAALLLAAERS